MSTSSCRTARGSGCKYLLLFFLFALLRARLLSHPADFGESGTDFSLSDGCPGPAYRDWSPNGQLKPRDPYDPSQTRPSDAAQESVRRGARPPPRGGAARCLPARSLALCARSRTTEQGSGVSPFKLPPHARLHVYTIGAANDASAGKVPHSEGVEPRRPNDAHQAAKSSPP